MKVKVLSNFGTNSGTPLTTYHRISKREALVHREKPGTDLRKKTELVKAFAKLYSKLRLDHIVVRRKVALSLRKIVDLTFCRYGPIEIVSNPPANAGARVVNPEVRIKERQRCCLNTDFDFVFLGLCNSHRSACDDSEEEAN